MLMLCAFVVLLLVLVLVLTLSFSPRHISGSNRSLGRFEDEADAARAWDAEARKHYAEEAGPPRQQAFGGWNFPANGSQHSSGTAAVPAATVKKKMPILGDRKKSVAARPAAGLDQVD